MLCNMHAKENAAWSSHTLRQSSRRDGAITAQPPRSRMRRMPVYVIVRMPVRVAQVGGSSPGT